MTSPAQGSPGVLPFVPPLRQAERDPMSATEQLAVLIVAMEGLFDGMSEQHVSVAMSRVRNAARSQLPSIDERVAENQALRSEDRERIVQLARDTLDGTGQTIADEVRDGPDT